MTDDNDFDVLVIGGGPGGYICAIRAAQLGLKTACAEKRATLGGTCLNVGCIPSKSLLHASHEYVRLVSGALQELGISFERPSFSLDKLMQQKNKTVKGLTAGIDFLFRKNKVTRLTGTAKFRDAKAVTIDGRIVRAKHIVIATGSVPVELASAPVDNDNGRIVDSTGALALSKVPSRLAVVGGGVIGLELGSIWNRLGSKVTVVEYLDSILPGMDPDVRVHMSKALKKQGVEIRASTAVASVGRQEDTILLELDDLTRKVRDTLAVDVVLVSVGRRPNTRVLCLEAAGLETDARGFIETDSYGATRVEGIYAIGDVTDGPMLAHKAKDEGVHVAEYIAGIGVEARNRSIIPAVVYTSPEAAGVGKTEEELRLSCVPYRAATFPMSAKTGRVLGVHIVADQAGTMIAQAVQAMEFGATAEDIAYTCHAHPTHNEALKKAAFASLGAVVHLWVRLA
ncbi:dihydrolipoyl dehydrogenase [Rhizobium sp. 1AS11]|uniref:dihydrolipoyl dehydrogenase n=1 Tax=Rhizobium acaciae TaxID=2989736 RepID=UPI002220D244|nr:dihydrolipoyl dehydrogenase [Rhizobium acaciae]MCW1411383.1 dihydrolipoyl dehydrogenase [Rhizobium acaciae]MCW1743585.1 dihydrolipoyl dehydrogenase [Rhizobium acaciae]MCW1749177.1 dihydrolipoyl dehydrogenase [Rhizobium acaciae]